MSPKPSCVAKATRSEPHAVAENAGSDRPTSSQLLCALCDALVPLCFKSKHEDTKIARRSQRRSSGKLVERRRATRKSGDTRRLYPRFFRQKPVQTKARAKINPTGLEPGVQCRA